ncbi:hypothetical protein OZD68_03795 [Wolbachia endosymbiont of Drosophila bicornuta]|nr:MULTISPECIES: hypothetical protein [Wolbachia]MDE5056698.1 hypothetical protein [Wolbachia endosymbiont of Drosophila bicornuta]
MLLACYSHKHISYRIRTIIRKAIVISIASMIFTTYGIIKILYIIICHLQLHLILSHFKRTSCLYF